MRRRMREQSSYAKWEWFIQHQGRREEERKTNKSNNGKNVEVKKGVITEECGRQHYYSQERSKRGMTKALSAQVVGSSRALLFTKNNNNNTRTRKEGRQNEESVRFVLLVWFGAFELWRSPCKETTNRWTNTTTIQQQEKGTKLPREGYNQDRKTIQRRKVKIMMANRKEGRKRTKISARRKMRKELNSESENNENSAIAAPDSDWRLRASRMNHMSLSRLLHANAVTRYVGSRMRVGKQTIYERGDVRSRARRSFFLSPFRSFYLLFR